MRVRELGLIAWVSGALLMIVFALVPPGARWQAFDRIIQVVSAIGTAAAVVAALWLGSKSTRESNAKAHDLALMVASGLTPELTLGLHELRTTNRLIKTAAQASLLPHPTSSETIHGAFFVLETLLKESVWDIPADQLAALCPIGNQAAHHIHRALSIMRNAKKIHAGTDLTNAERPELYQVHQLVAAGSRLSIAEKHLSTGLSSLESAIEKLQLDGVWMTPQK